MKLSEAMAAYQGSLCCKSWFNMYGTTVTAVCPLVGAGIMVGLFQANDLPTFRKGVIKAMVANQWDLTCDEVSNIAFEWDELDDVTANAKATLIKSLTARGL